MKKLLAMMLMFAMVFCMAACGGDTESDAAQDGAQDGAQAEVQDDAQAETEGPDLEVLTESDQIVLRMPGGKDLPQGDTLNAMDLSGVNLEVYYGGELVTGYELVIDGNACVNATMWEEDNFHLDAFKNGTCDLVIVYGEEKATYPVFVEGMPEELLLNWIGYIVWPAGEYGDGVFGTPGLDDDITVLYNGEPISDYTYTVADESLAEVTKNADGSLHIKALKEGEVLEFLTIEYNGLTRVFGLCI